VVDRVELRSLDHSQQVGDLDRDDALGLQYAGQPADELIQVGNVREHVVGHDQVGRHASADELLGELAAEEGDLRRHARLDRHFGDVGCRLDPEHGDAVGDEVPEEIAVVARDFEHERLRAELKPPPREAGEAGGVVEPGLGVRREVRIVGEDLRRRDGVVDLHEQALGADTRVQRVATLGSPRQFVAREKAVGQRLEAKVEERVPQRGSAGAARGPGAHSRSS
jgi:hypothetical protein